MCIDCGLVNLDEIIDGITNLLSKFLDNLAKRVNIAHFGTTVYNQWNSNSREILINSTFLQLT